ncbi:MoxR family ATPase [Stieleria sp. JC731]|uniref:AAA family ATPase n=1 Tax=Pirellulaceae TaxID=2691357 RepID=UPI001E366324|nr:MoxR family ATPase [Stieleria sp. JC731]MCC9602697.1 MoxR family ATPase [Stieleria sp. JC731]
MFTQENDFGSESADQSPPTSGEQHHSELNREHEAMTAGSDPLETSVSTAEVVAKAGSDGQPPNKQDTGQQSTDQQTPDQLLAKLEQVRDQLQGVIRGKADVIDSVLTCILAEGSVLLEDVPGVGKTTLAKSIASLIDLDFKRIQCTPDLLPSDILGNAIFQPTSGEFHFRRGPIFCNLLIADEINRASPRTQSALLEAMAESQVTIDSSQYRLERPFIVIATQNPSGFEGTYPLPESQLDRFLFRLSMDYPDVESEVDLLLDQAAKDPSSELTPVMHRDELASLQRYVREVSVDPKVARYLVEVVNATRQDSRLRVGCSPRGSKMLLRAAQARAVLSRRSYVLPDDIQEVAVAVLAHRISMRSVSGSWNDAAAVIDELLRQTEVIV